MEHLAELRVPDELLDDAGHAPEELFAELTHNVVGTAAKDNPVVWGCVPEACGIIQALLDHGLCTREAMTTDTLLMFGRAENSMPQAAISLAHAWTLTDEERSHIWFDLKRGVVCYRELVDDDDNEKLEPVISSEKALAFAEGMVGAFRQAGFEDAAIIDILDQANEESLVVMDMIDQFGRIGQAARRLGLDHLRFVR